MNDNDSRVTKNLPPGDQILTHCSSASHYLPT